MCITGIPGEERRKKGKITDVCQIYIMARNLVENVNSQMQEGQKTPNGINKNTTGLRHITGGKVLKVKGKKTVLKEAREKHVKYNKQ